MAMWNPPHPGRIVKRQCLEPLGLTVTRAAKGGRPGTLHGRRPGALHEILAEDAAFFVKVVARTYSPGG